MKQLGTAVVCAIGTAILFGAWTGQASAQEDTVSLCRTFEKWAAKQEQTQGSNCPIDGTCDIPSERDSWIPDASSELLNVRIKFIVFAEDDGSNPAATQEEVDDQVEVLNQNYEPSGFRFLHETEFVNSTEFRFWDSNEEFAMKQTYADDPEHKLNVFVVAVSGSFSFGTFPWDGDALTALGGIVMNEFQFGGNRTTMAHEIGHNLGLWHTHHGVSEVSPCSSCYEQADGTAGDTTGDFAGDTDPTPTNFSCGPPAGNDGCSGAPWDSGSSDFRNFMGYGPSINCRDFFSEHQKGRSRCWFADVLTGWLATDPALRFSFPQGLPSYAAPNQSETFQLQVTGDVGITPDPGKAKARASIDGGPFNLIPVTHLGNDLYDVDLPAASTCGSSIEFYFDAPATDTQLFLDPPGAPAESYRALVAFGPRILVDEGFEADVSAWSVVNDGSLTSGAWEQADPIGTSAGSELAAPGSSSNAAAQNLLAFVTENGLAGGAADDADVDGGPTDLVSPPIDLAGDDGLIRYDRWFFSDGADTLSVWVSGNGTSWTLVETVDGTNNSWQTVTFQVSDYITPTSTVQVRFRAGDSPDDSITEAAIDEFRVTELRCSSCSGDGECTDVVFCNGLEQCVSGSCAEGAEPCPGLLCDDLVDTCVDCFVDADCDDSVFCNGAETCVANVCTPASDPCPGMPCDDGFDVCIECLINSECDDGVFCNGEEICFAPGVCGSGDPACPALCNEGNGACIGNAFPQPLSGMPLERLTIGQLDRFAQGASAFGSTLNEADGLGPAYNATGCAACHDGIAIGAASSVTETRFGFDDGAGNFDPLTNLGGSLLQADGLSALCTEALPPEANVTSERLTTQVFGAGLIEAIPDADIEDKALNPPAGISGRVNMVPVLEQAGAMRVGRFGWKSQYATVRSTSVEMARDSLGLTTLLRAVEHAPNGDDVLLAQCDTQPDPEDLPDVAGVYFDERVTDFQRLLASPPQTPPAGMNGETFFVAITGCSNCHVRQFTTTNDATLEGALRNRLIKPYSDFLLHDMGDAGDPIAEGDATPNEVRTAPLWGLRLRESLWHDGRISGGTFEDRVLAAIAEHGAPGSEAALSAFQFNGLPGNIKTNVIAFLGSLGRATFDQDGDNDVDADDYALIQGCFTGPGSFYGPDDPCSVSDVDQDGDVDDDDLDVFNVFADGEAGQVPDGASVPGVQLTLDPAAAGQVTLNWGASCLAGDVDYAIYEGTLGDYTSHGSIQCSTGGLTTSTISPGAGSTYYLVVPSNGFKEGSQGNDSSANPRPQGSPSCLPQAVGACSP